MRITIRLLSGLFIFMVLTDPLYEEEPINPHPIFIMIAATIFVASFISMGDGLPAFPRFDHNPDAKIIQKQEEDEDYFVVSNAVKHGVEHDLKFGIVYGDDFVERQRKIREWYKKNQKKKHQDLSAEL